MAPRGLKGKPEALAAVFPATTLQTCIVHLIRNSLGYASWKDRKALAAAIRPIYTTNAIENINSQLRKIIKTRGHSTSDQATTKLIWLALLNITAEWGRPARN